MPGYSGGGSSTPKYKAKPLTGGGGSNTLNLPANDSMGKGSINLFDVGGSLGETAGNFAEFGGGAIGGIAGAIGSLGPDGETASIGQLFEDVGRIPGGIGDIQLPYLGGPEGQAATLSEIPGKMLDIIGTPGRALERTFAGQRVEAAQRGEDLDIRDLFRASVGTPLALIGGEGEGERGLPPDLQQRLDAGESVDVIADELVARGAGFSGGGISNLTSQIIFDPLNVLAPGANQIASGVKAAGHAVQVPAQYAAMGIGRRAAGIAYNTASRNMGAAGAAFVDKTLGPVTSGAFFALGTKPYRSLASSLGGLNPDYATRLDDALGVANANLHGAVIADDMANDIAARLASVDNLDEAAAARLQAKRAYAPDELERRAQEMLERTAPDFLQETPESLAELTARSLSVASDVSIEDARRIIGATTDVKTAQTVHWARYGRAIDDFGEAREASRIGKTNIDLDRLTLIADDTMTVERAKDLLKTEPVMLRDEAMRYSVVANYFLGKNPDDGQVIAFVQNLLKKQALPSAVRTVKSGKNKLPNALGEWRQKYLDNGYDLGFAPEDGLKTLEDESGNVLWAKPWVGVTTRRDPVTVRNGLGRAMDSMFRGITQTTIVQQSRQRMVTKAVQSGIPVSPNQIRSIHKAIVEEAATRALTPRALTGDKLDGEPLYNAIFKRFLSDEEYAELTAKYDPTYLVMHAFEGNWRTVGLTQKLTGRSKAYVPTIAKITEALYPKARFTYRPNFQLQEMVESKALNAMRGIEPRDIDPDVAAAYRALAEQPEFKYLTEATYLNIAGDRLATQFMGANTSIGRAMGRFTNISQRKEVARVTQTLSEHGDEFKGAIQNIDPKAWAAMEEAYGTTDPRIIADRFLAERMRLGSNENIDDAMAAVDDASSMYHVTTAKDAVAREGLRPRSATGQAGLGGGEVDMAPDLISATTSAERADAIERTLNIAVRAARDEISTDEIFAFFRGQFDSPKDVAEMTGRTFGQTTWDDIASDFADFGYSAEGKYELVALLDNALLRKGKMSVGITSGWDEMARIDPSQIAKLRVRAKGSAREEFAPEQELRFAEGDLLVEADRASFDPAAEMVWQVFKDSFRQSSNWAFKTHFFNPQRGWLERTLNHPYLGLYPLSYMWGKVLPEFARFLIARPFGMRAPLVGFEAVNRVRQAYLGALQDDPEFNQYIQSNAAAIYFANLIFPGNPANLTVNAPAYARHLSQDAAAGRPLTLNTVGREIADSAAYALNPVSDVTTFGKPASDVIGGAEDIFASLQKSAAEFDGMFAVTGAPPAP